MRMEPGTHCPLLDKECIQFKCTFWTQLRGAHPQSGKEIDEWACAIAWLPILLIENAKEVRQGAAATESLRNELVSRIDRARLNAQGQDARMTLIEAEEVPDGKEE